MSNIEYNIYVIYHNFITVMQLYLTEEIPRLPSDGVKLTMTQVASCKTPIVLAKCTAINLNSA